MFAPKTLQSRLRCFVVATVGLVSCLVAMPVIAVTNYTATPLGTLGGTNSEGHAINSSGQVTGVSLTTGDAAYRAFLYSGGSMINLGTLGGNFYSEGLGINDSGRSPADRRPPARRESMLFSTQAAP